MEFFPFTDPQSCKTCLSQYNAVTVFIADDIIASGESMLEVAGNLKERGAARIIANATFPLFTSGLKKFDQAVADGKLDYVVGTNLTYRQPELLTRDWYVDVDVSKYAAYFVVALNHDMSVSSIIDPIKKTHQGQPWCRR